MAKRKHPQDFAAVARRQLEQLGYCPVWQSGGAACYRLPGGDRDFIVPPVMSEQDARRLAVDAAREAGVAVASRPSKEAGRAAARDRRRFRRSDADAVQAEIAADRKERRRAQERGEE